MWKWKHAHIHGTHSCPRCGAKTRQIHDYRMRKIKHL
ncbi:transposase family protein [Bacillus andreraoultii]